jgi:L-ascorbate metabolism protein UlaG (beta-lactamase superfamily)
MARAFLDRLREVPVGPGRLAVSWLGQAGFAVSGSGGTALVDPFLSAHEGRRYESALAPAEAVGIDLVVCSHEHLDHFDALAAPAIARSSPGAVFVVPSPIVDMVTEVGVPADRVTGMQPGESLELAGFDLHAVAARHGVTPEDAYGFGRELSGGLVRFLGFVLDSGGVRLYHAGDTIHYEGMEQQLRELHPDVAMLPINGRDAEREARGIVGNLNEREAAWLAGQIDADWLVPMHHDLFEGNLGSAARVVEIVEQERREVAVVVPVRDAPFVVTSGRAP